MVYVYLSTLLLVYSILLIVSQKSSQFLSFGRNDDACFIVLIGSNGKIQKIQCVF
jgi:hypothetical protein